MQWEIKGADNVTGTDRTVIVEADTEESARRRARRQGVMVAEVRPLETGDSVAGERISKTVQLAPMPPEQVGGERVLVTAKLHPAAVFIVPGILTLIGIGFILLPFAYLQYRFTEFIITSRRITIRRGWLNRSTFEMLLSKIESVHVEQPMLGRLIGAGTVVICGIGGNREVFSGIRDPERFRMAATDAIEHG